VNLRRRRDADGRSADRIDQFGVDVCVDPAVWEPAISGEAKHKAATVAADVAARLCDEQRVMEAIRNVRRQTSSTGPVEWMPHSVAQGSAGLALMCGYLDQCFPDSGWDVHAHRLLTAAARSAAASAAGPGLFDGLCGVGLATHMLSRQGSRYAQMASSIDAAVVPSAHALADSVENRTGGVSVSEVDVVSGLTGIATYLLTKRADPPIGDGLTRTLTVLTTQGATPGGTVTSWVTPPHLLGSEKLVARYPHGGLDCGLAHGVPGPLALVSMALADGYAVVGSRDFVSGAASWLVDHRRDDRWGPNWPTLFSLPLEAAGNPRDAPSRAAWCYGVPGVARALWLAGRALQDDGLQRFAVEAMEGVYRRPIWARQIDSPTFCHGVAGLLQVTLRFYHDTRLALFRDAATELTHQILAAYEPNATILGFRSMEPGGSRTDQPGLLDGAAGIAMVLLAATTSVEPAWDRIFLLA
jgi:hypothetical protein